MTNPTPAAAAATGRCPVCGQNFTTSAHQRPRRRYCSERCRKTAWRHRHPRTRPVPRRGDVALPGDVARDGDLAVEPSVAARTEPVARCPHCARPIAVITLLVHPAAATVPVPGAGHAR
jgi:endogenous inhibitor of DNA gyrase (YacG/DUF329 family)